MYFSKEGVCFMGKYDVAGMVGLRHKKTRQLIAAYPEPLAGTDKEVEEKVKFWYYQKDCGSGDHLDEYYVDTLTEREIPSLGK